MDVGLAIATLSKLRRLNAQARWSRAQVADLQAQRLSELRAYAYAHSPFYQRFHKGLEHAPLSELPVLTKALVMDNFDEVATDPAVRLEAVRAFVARHAVGERYLRRYWVSSTSGASGRPGLFLADQDEWSTELATALRAFEDAGLRLGLNHRTRVAQITSTNPAHLTTQGGRSLANWWMPTLLMDASEGLGAMVARLNAQRPQMLWAYASVIRSLAEEQLAGRLKIAPRIVLSASELLTDGIRRRAVEAWGEVVFNTYATTDCGGLGAECDRHLGMHLQEDLAIIEVVDHANRPVEPGAFGDKLLVTVLGGRTQPLIRYELEDSLRLAARACTCGRPFRLIDAVRGRIEETLSFPAVSGGTIAVHPNLFSNVMDTLPVTGWQVVQADDGLRVLIVGAGQTLDEAAVASSLRAALEGRGALCPPIAVERVAAIPSGAGGKTPLVRSERRDGHTSAPAGVEGQRISPPAP